MSGHMEVLASWPDASLFSFPPNSHPAPLPPHPQPLSVMHPFNIPSRLFTAALDVRVPLAIAATYAISAKALNKYNKSRNKRPWSISQTRTFFAFVVLHNVFLAVYSAWTFWGMVNTMKNTIASPFGPGGIAATVDSVCHIHGNPGLGNSLFYDDANAKWDSVSQAQLNTLTGAGVPSNTQMGRMWNEGLAFYGWIFYLSKFYEVLDTFIILAKGKYSSTLQTYHHAGAMMSMWAGMRFMSAPIWVFALVNSFIHAMMYTYYTLTAFSIKVPMGVKRTLTTMQITQFLVGASYAMVHSFISYTTPINIVDVSKTPISLTAGAAHSVVPGAVKAAGSLKQMILGGAAPADASASNTLVSHVIEPCIVTNGETFAIWLNVVYLAPLTYLFISFFITSYVKRSNAANKLNGSSSRRHSNVTLAEKAGWDAARGIEREVYGGEKMVNGNNSSAKSSAIVDIEAVPEKANGKKVTRRR